jgi:protein-disulfide isomerase
MSQVRGSMAAVLVVGLSVSACAQSPAASAQGQPAPGQDQVVAEVGGRKITLKEVEDRWQQDDPTERQRVTQLLYQHRRNHLDQVVGDLLIEEAATTAGVSVEDYERAEIEKRLLPITDADIQNVYDANRDRVQGRPLEELRDSIREFIAGNRIGQARAQLVEELKGKQGNVRVLLDAPRLDVAVAPHNPTKGPANAAITIIEFSDYQCPFCARVNPTLDRIMQEYDGKVRIVFRDFPLPTHAEAPKAAEAGHCAGEQGKYWEMHDRMFANQQALGVPALKQHAAALSLDTAKFDACLDSGKFAANVEADIEAGRQLGVNSTPMLYINGRPVAGAQPFEYFQGVIEEELARTSR